MTTGLQIRPFDPRLQDEVRRLVAYGLSDYFDDFDEALNADILDIGTH